MQLVLPHVVAKAFLLTNRLWTTLSRWIPSLPRLHQLALRSPQVLPAPSPFGVAISLGQPPATFGSPHNSLLFMSHPTEQSAVFFGEGSRLMWKGIARLCRRNGHPNIRSVIIKYGHDW